jgi:hypothetical protein
MIGAGTCSTDIYEAVVSVTRSIGGRTDLRSLLSGVAEALGRIVTFDHLGLVLHDPIGNAMEGYILNAPGNPVLTSLRLPVDDDPSGWVRQNQQPLMISIRSEARWPAFVNRARDEFGSAPDSCSLTAGNNGWAHSALARSHHSIPA